MCCLVFVFSSDTHAFVIRPLEVARPEALHHLVHRDDGRRLRRREVLDNWPDRHGEQGTCALRGRGLRA